MAQNGADETIEESGLTETQVAALPCDGAAPSLHPDGSPGGARRPRRAVALLRPDGAC